MPVKYAWVSWLDRASLQSEKDHLNIDIYRGFIERFGLFWDHREALVIFLLNMPVYFGWNVSVIHIQYIAMRNKNQGCMGNSI